MNKWHLRFAVTSNCNFNCQYCNTNVNHKEQVEDKEIKEILKAAKMNEIDKIHWTGGEPLVRKNIGEFIQYAKKIGYCKQAITTNGFLLEKMADQLISSGIDRFNISLDTMKEEKFKQITGVNGLNKVLNGINKVLKNSTCQIKINMVVMKENLGEINDFIDFAKTINQQYGKDRIVIRFLQFFPCNPNQLKKEGQDFWKKEYIGVEDILEELRKKGKLLEKSREFIDGDNPTIKYYEIDQELTIGILAMFSWGYPCGECFKLRITPYGYASCCLNDEKMDLLVGLSVQEKAKCIQKVINRRNTIVDADKDRRHYRKKLGEVRFGEKGNQIEMKEFYHILNR